MALSDQARLQIIEEERVRWTTRQVLMEQAWAGQRHHLGEPRRRALRLLWWLPLLALVAWSLGRLNF